MNVIKLLFNDQPAGEVALRPSIPKNKALLCLEPSCEALFEAGGGGPGVPDTCPRCGGAQTWPIAKGLDRETAGEPAS